MGPYIPVLIWLISAVICSFIAKRRKITPTLFWTLLVVVLGPLAIPLVFLTRPVKSVSPD